MGISYLKHTKEKIRVQVRQSGLKKTKVFLKSEKKKAEQWGLETLMKFREQKVTSFTDTMTLREVLKLYLTEEAPNLQNNGFKRKESVVRQINKEDFADTRIDLLTTGMLTRYKNRMLNEYKLSESTARKQLCTISVAIRYYITVNDSTIENPMDGVTLPPSHSKPREFVIFEVNEILNVLKEKNRNAYVATAIAAYTGMRKGEIEKLHWDDVDLMETNSLFVKTVTSKGSLSRTLTINAKLQEILKEHLLYKLKNYKSIKKKAKYRQKMNYVITTTGDNFVRHFKKAVRSLQLEHDYRFHDLRHTFLSKLSDTGIDIFTLQDISGHKDIETLKKYIHKKDIKREFTDKITY